MPKGVQAVHTFQDWAMGKLSWPIAPIILNGLAPKG